MPYIAKELQWSIGEKRTYGVYVDGERVGTETAQVGDIEVIDGEEVYRFTASSDVNMELGRQVTKAEQLLTPQGLPRRIVLEYNDPIEKKVTTYDFAEDTVVIKPGKEGDEEFEKSNGREYPFAKGTYFTDPRLLTHWALLAGQVPLEPDAEKEFPIHHFLPSKSDSREMLIEVGDKEEVRLEPTLSADKREMEETETETETESTESEGETKPEAEVKPEGEDAKPEVEAPKPEGENTSQDEPELPEGNSITADPLSTLPTSPTAKVQMATQLITDTGIEFWLSDRNQIVKIVIPDQGIELILEKVETSLD